MILTSCNVKTFVLEMYANGSIIDEIIPHLHIET